MGSRHNIGKKEHAARPKCYHRTCLCNSRMVAMLDNGHSVGGCVWITEETRCKQMRAFTLSTPRSVSSPRRINARPEKDPRP